MPTDSRNTPTESGKNLVDALRQCYGLGASFFRAAAARIEMTETDIHVIALLESAGDSTAGQLATLMGLTTGTFTAILNRLEKAGMVHRERDPNDGRRVIVRRTIAADGTQESRPLFANLGKAWEDMAAQYDDAQKAFLVEFLHRSNTLAQEEIARLRATSVGDEGIFSAPLVDRHSGRLVFHGEGVRLRVRAGGLAGALYQARFEGPVPAVKVKDGVVTIRYPKRLWLPGKEQRTAEVTLSTAIPWQIALKGGGAEMTAELGDLDLRELAANGAGSIFHIELPTPTRVVPIHLGGSGSAFTLGRPRGVAARAQLKGWGSGMLFDTQAVSELSADRRFQSPDYADNALSYDIELAGSGSMLTVTTG